MTKKCWHDKITKKMKPTDSELEILQVLWQEGTCTVRQVNERLAENRDVGYTTTLKLMQIMHEKGLLTRMEEARSHVYEANVSEDETQATLLERFVDTAFRGSASKLVMQALGNHKSTAAEIDEIRKLLDQIEQQP
jgi:BlaI family penicillinase repressor